MVDWLFAELPLPAAAAEPAEDVLPAVLALLEAPTAWLLLDNGLEAASAGGVFAAAGALAVLASAEGFLAGVGALIVPAAPVLAVFVALLADVDAALPPCAAALGACVSCEVDLTDFPAPLLPPAWLLAAAALLLFNTLGAALVSACSPLAAACGDASKLSCCCSCTAVVPMALLALLPAAAAVLNVLSAPSTAPEAITGLSSMKWPLKTWPSSKTYTPTPCFLPRCHCPS
jgi:hypothetical protein